jgi:lipopolysaccharide biosynthesis protein
VLLAHYDPHDIIDDYVVNAVRVLHKSDSDVVLITSTDKAVEIGRVRPLCAAILLKPNVGRDFGSWYLACQAYQTRFSQYESVIWMNDSTYFPLFDPSEMFSTMDRRKLDFWGVVDSHLITWHVMSWFWAFSRKVNESGWIDWYLREFNPTFTKWDQIRNFEMRMPMLLSSRGYAIGSYISANEVFSYTVSHVPNQRGFSGRRDFNMAHECWDIIIQKFRCPSLKVELLRDNPLGIDIENALEFIRDNTQYDTELIRRHIRRIKTAHLAQLSGSEQPQYKLDAIESTRLLNHHLPAIV